MINKETMQSIFEKLGKEALAMNHYELTVESGGVFTTAQWKEFLSLPETQEYINKEMAIIRNSQVNKIIQESGDSRSVGQAQILSALQKVDSDDNKKDGPVFIFCHVPLNNEQKFAPNIMEVDENGHPRSTTLPT